MPADFVGLSYELQQLVDPSFFSAQNTGLIREFTSTSFSTEFRSALNFGVAVHYQGIDRKRLRNGASRRPAGNA